MRIRRAVPCLALAAIIAGCAGHPNELPPVESPTMPSAAFDGTYRGTVQATGAISGADVRWCATDPQLLVHVSNGGFSYTQTHPNAPAQMAAESTVTYAATITADGTISGASEVSGNVQGRVSGSHMEGTLAGLGCYYSFAADRT
jgi:hypothetical protein